ncbi:sulfotransferase family 2 domain-containing protein [Oceanibium sediminis]|uniref:sulfotransferase family 2 domain-containing protein n=1 Tax=Oceanibium sediminis TaxID=2026339 RepID=UPI000DD36678|nr:sulfotransferase family 2 domain-containing protein [Oceanibium sediminis]
MQSVSRVLLDRHFSPFRLALAPERGLALVLNPKVGSSFLRDLLAEGYRQHLGRSDPSDGRYRVLNVARRMPLAPVGAYWGFLRRPQDFAVHTIVRNPYARLVSAWRDKFRDGHFAQGGAIAGYPRSIRAGVLAKLRAHAAAKGLPGADEGELVPFDTFLSFVQSEPEGRRNKHWEEQWRVILWDKLPYTGVIRMEEDMGPQLAQILSPLGFPPDWVIARTSRPVNASHKLREPVLNAANAALISALYARDFKVFGYDPDSWAGY